MFIQRRFLRFPPHDANLVSDTSMVWPTWMLSKGTICVWLSDLPSEFWFLLRNEGHLAWELAFVEDLPIERKKESRPLRELLEPSILPSWRWWWFLTKSWRNEARQAMIMASRNQPLVRTNTSSLAQRGTYKLPSQCCSRHTARRCRHFVWSSLPQQHE